MLRALALLLLLGNLLLWAYGQGHLAPLGLAPHQAREPERLAQQVARQANKSEERRDKKKAKIGKTGK